MRWFRQLVVAPIGGQRVQGAARGRQRDRHPEPSVSAARLDAELVRVDPHQKLAVLSLQDLADQQERVVRGRHHVAIRLQRGQIDGQRRHGRPGELRRRCTDGDSGGVDPIEPNASSVTQILLRACVLVIP